MDYFKKESTSETTQSFSPRIPLGQKLSQNLPFVSQIQELMAILVQKKSELKEAKLRQSCLLGKQEQQEVRISKIKIAMDHQIEKEQMLRNHQDRLQQQICSSKQSIKQMTKCVKTAKNQLAELLQDIIIGKKNKMDLVNVCSQLQNLIQGKSAQNQKIDEHTQDLETLLLSTQNSLRSKQDQLTQLQLQKTELISLLNFLDEKQKLAMRAKNSTHAQGQQLCQNITKSQQKLHNLKKQISQLDWNCQQIRVQNNQIDGLNTRLQADLEAVKKHLLTMEKMNVMLRESLGEYGVTGDRVTRMINAAKTM